jgi:hypothetical protein
VLPEGDLMTTMARRAALATGALNQALLNAAARGQCPRCSDGEASWMFTDEDPRVRAVAATYCNGCVVWSECNEVGVYQQFGVWAGKDRTRSPGHRSEAA